MASVQRRRPLLEDTRIAYTAVEPIWGGPKPHWLDEYGNLGGTIAVKNHGPAPFVFEEQRKTPLGVNMAVRRSLIEQIGGFRPDLGRNGKSLLGQEQAEWLPARRRRTRRLRTGDGCRASRASGTPDAPVLPSLVVMERYFARAAAPRAAGDGAGHRSGKKPRGSSGCRDSCIATRCSTRPVRMRALAGDARARAEEAMAVLYFVGYVWDSRRGPIRTSQLLATRTLS